MKKNRKLQKKRRELTCTLRPKRPKILPCPCWPFEEVIIFRCYDDGTDDPDAVFMIPEQTGKQ